MSRGYIAKDEGGVRSKWSRASRRLVGIARAGVSSEARKVSKKTRFLPICKIGDLKVVLLQKKIFVKPPQSQFRSRLHAIHSRDSAPSPRCAETRVLTPQRTGLFFL